MSRPGSCGAVSRAVERSCPRARVKGVYKGTDDASPVLHVREGTPGVRRGQR